MADIAISEVRICNMALSRIGASSAIESLTEGSAESHECNLWYHFSRQQALAANDWSFARRRLTLATHSDDPPDGVWGFRYQYPSDCVVLRKIQNPTGASLVVDNEPVSAQDAIPFEVETDLNQDTLSILTDLDNAVGVYTFDLKTVTLFSEFFVLLLATAISVNIAYALTGKTELVQAQTEAFLRLSGAAASSNANERVGKAPREAEWIRDR
jgi:hypothetical protein